MKSNVRFPNTLSINAVFVAAPSRLSILRIRLTLTCLQRFVKSGSVTSSRQDLPAPRLYPHPTPTPTLSVFHWCISPSRRTREPVSNRAHELCRKSTPPTKPCSLDYYSVTHLKYFYPINFLTWLRRALMPRAHARETGVHAGITDGQLRSKWR